MTNTKESNLSFLELIESLPKGELRQEPSDKEKELWLAYHEYTKQLNNQVKPV